jgi:hypothetical protein
MSRRREKEIQLCLSRIAQGILQRFAFKHQEGSGRVHCCGWWTFVILHLEDCLFADSNVGVGHTEHNSYRKIQQGATVSKIDYSIFI